MVCQSCSQPYTTSENPNEDRRPHKFGCSNGDVFCGKCCSKLTLCPVCKTKPIGSPILENMSKLKENLSTIEKQFPKIPFDDIKFVSKAPKCQGTFADIYHCSWNNTEVALKKLNVKPCGDQVDHLSQEAEVGMLLNYPNIVRLFGLTTFPNDFQGMVMEWADKGTLREQMDHLTFAQKVSISSCICAGLTYLHCQKIAHRDLKPESILLFGDDLTSKISAFGASKAIQTFASSTSGIKEAPQYLAPELFGNNPEYSLSADVYSFAIILYEIFSGQSPFPGADWEVYAAKQKNEYPKIPSGFPMPLGQLIQRGFSSTPKERPLIKEFESVLTQMKGNLLYKNK